VNLDIEAEGEKAQKEMAGRKQLELDERTDTELPGLMRSSELDVKGPPPERYNYRGMHQDDGNFVPDEDGGIALQNKHASGIEVAGVDINTGKKTGAQYYGGSIEASIAAGWPEDEMDLVASGRDKLAESHFNTVTGHPDADVEALTEVYRGAMKQGAAKEDVDIPGWPEPQKEEAAAAAVSLNLTEHDIGQVINGTFDYGAAMAGTVDPIPAEPGSIPEDTMREDSGWVADTQIVMDYLGKGDYEALHGEPHAHMMYEMA